MNDVAAEVADEVAGRLIVDLSDAKKRRVAVLVRRGLEQGWDDQTLAAKIAGAVGLDARYTAAVENYRKTLVDNGTPKGRARDLARDYAQRLREHRAGVIARTEVQGALLEAQRRLWTDQQERGELSRYAVRVTRVHPDCCSTTCRKYNGRRNSLRRDAKGDAPPFHPQCRCYEEIEDQGIAKTHPTLIGNGPEQIMKKDLTGQCAHCDDLGHETSEHDAFVSKAITPGGRVGDDSSLDSSPKKNWVENAGGLPKYIRMVAHALIRSGKPKDKAISMAIGIVRNWAEGKGKVSPKVRAAAAKAIAEWEAKKAKSHVTKAAATTWDLVAWQEARAQLRSDGII